MLIKQRNIILLVLVVMLPIFKAKAYARPLGDEEKVRLRGSIKAQSYADLTIDVMLMKQVETKPEAVKNAKEAALEETKRLRKESNDDTITLKSVGIALPDGSEFRLSKRRIRIGSGKIRIDTTIFANEEMTETNYESTTINSLFDTNVPSYQIDHKLKRAFINNLRWSGREVLRFGKVDEDILMDIVRLCNPESHAKASKNKDFSYKSISNVDGQVVDEIECVNIESSQVKYKISLDPNNWRICLKIVRYDDKSGLASKIVEYKEFEKAGGSGELYPRLIIQRYFDEEGKEEKVETIIITNVVIGLPIPEDIFKLDVPTDYTIIDNRGK